MNPVESADSLGLTGSSVGGASGKRQSKGPSAVTRVCDASVTDSIEAIESETPEVGALIHEYHICFSTEVFNLAIWQIFRRLPTPIYLYVYDAEHSDSQI